MAPAGAGEVALITAVCIDDRNGLLFNGRRLSRDRAQQEDLLAFCRGKRLWMAPGSAPLFAGREADIRVDRDFLDHAGAGEVCLMEDRLPESCADRVEAVLLYRWNRTYPSDVRWDLDLTDFTLVEQLEFPGTSHERITRELYQRKGHHGAAQK